VAQFFIIILAESGSVLFYHIYPFALSSFFIRLPVIWLPLIVPMLYDEHILKHICSSFVRLGDTVQILIRNAQIGMPQASRYLFYVRAPKQEQSCRSVSQSMRKA